MINLNFILDDTFLISNIIINHGPKRFIEYALEKYQADIVKFQNLAYEKSQDCYWAVEGKFPLYRFNILESENSYSKSGKIIQDYIEQLSHTKEYKVLREQTHNTIATIQSEWNKNYSSTQKYIFNLGININGDFNIYLTHPGLKAGSAIGKNNIIWSDQKYWPNYNTVYLWHEILHSYFDNGDIPHALIEFITDNEMRSQLNGDTYPPFEGHAFLQEIKVKNLDKWKKFLAQDHKDIQKFLASMD